MRNNCFGCMHREPEDARTRKTATDSVMMEMFEDGKIGREELSSVMSDTLAKYSECVECLMDNPS